MTPEAIKELESELNLIIKKRRPKLIEEMQLAAENGDFSENHAYQMAKHKLRGMNARIEELEKRISRAIPIETGPTKDGKIRIGCQVTLEVNNKVKYFEILGAHETDPSLGKISHLSPLGKILIGKKVGDTAVLENDDRKIEYKILEIK